MSVFLDWLAAAATGRPRSVLAMLAVATVGLAALASSLEVEVDLAQLGSEDSAAVQAMDRVREEFADPTAVVQVILDAGPGGNMLTGRGLEAIEAAGGLAVNALGSDIRAGEDGQPQVMSLALAVEAALAQQEADPADVSDEQVGAIAARLVTANPRLAGLLSDDFDVDEGRARATVVVVSLDPELSNPERIEAGERIQAAFETGADRALAEVDVTVFSSGLFRAGLADEIRAEVPLMFGLALLVVLAILAVMYRSIFDVAVGFVGLLATVVWTLGFAALLGPAYLSWTGPLTQLVVVIPVLLVGLGIDYSVHLTARYREQRAGGQTPAAAAGRALHTVGTALVLATAATAVGFASIATAPVGMLADFGVVVGVGVVCAFVLMGLLVPAARVWRDTRKTDAETAAVRELGLTRLMRGPAWLARRAPISGLAAAVLAVGASLVAATALEVEFDRDDFIPEGSDIETLLAHQQELFGGGVTEATFVVIDGNLTNPAVANAILEAQHSVGDIADVSTIGDTPQVLSMLSMAAAVLDPASGLPSTAPESPAAGTAEGGPPPQEADEPAPRPQVEGWTGDGFADDADIAAVYDLLRLTFGEGQVGQLLAPDAQAAVVQIRTTAGDAGAQRLQRDVEAAFAALNDADATFTVTSEPIIIAEMSEDLSAFQAQAIAFTLVVVLALLTLYYALARRRWLLGLIAMIPAVISASLILGTMWLLGISFNVLTATLTAIAIGIGVPYGVHVVNRFTEELENAAAADAIARTLRGTGAALAGSALTTLGAFVVLAFSGLPPMRSLGLLGGIGIAFALLAALLVEPGALVLWARRTTATSPTAHHNQPTVGRSE